MHMRLYLPVACFLAAGTVWAQAPAPAFEVASLKPNTTGRAERGGPPGPNVKFDPGNLTMANVPLKNAFSWAFHMFPYQISGPGWMESDRYDINAKTSSAESEAQLRQSLQKLLTDRFKATVHRETKEMQAYIITVSKTGIKFKESVGEGEMEIKPSAAMSVEIKHATMAQLADLIGYAPLPDPVVDQTGLTGKYDMSLNLLNYAAQIGDHPSGIDDVIQVIVQAVQEQLGLKIERHKAPIEMVIIDHIERAPTEN